MLATPTEIQACTSLTLEHRQMEQLLTLLKQELSQLSKKNDTMAVQVVMSQIESEMNTHFACEEQVLFPAVSPYHPMVLMEVEHEELVALRTKLLGLLAGEHEKTAETIAWIQEKGQRFISDLLDHMGREDAGIFPTCEQALSQHEKQQIVEEMEAIRVHSLQQPTPAITRPEKTFQSYSIDLLSTPQRALMSHRVFNTTDWEAKHITIRGGESLASHWIPNQALLICLRGAGDFIANQQKQPLMPGGVIVMSPQLQHAIAAESDCDLLFLIQTAKASK
jgi:hemerythrin-like domain-containing protein/quercetin dioxygenase-like cupin family protein